MAIRIVSDSTVGLPRQLAESLNVTLVPAYVLIDDVAYREGVDISQAEFYDRLQTSARLPTTSQPTPADFSEHVAPLLDAGHQVICLTIARQLSGTYNSAIQAAAEFPDGAVTVVDSNTATVGHMLQVAAAAADAAAPDSTLDGVVAAMQERAARGYVYCALDTLEYLKKGGRIGKAQAFMGSLLNVKPIISVAGGELLPVERTRNMRRALGRLEELVRARGPATHLGVAYTTDAAPAADLLAQLRDLAPAEQCYTIQIGSAVGTHGGPGAIAVATI